MSLGMRKNFCLFTKVYVLQYYSSDPQEFFVIF